MEQKRIIWVTGGVGAGKSRVLKILEADYKAQVIEADQVARELMEPGGASHRVVVELMGQGILSADGAIDRPAMAQRIFSDRVLLEQVNARVHPLVVEALRERTGRSQARLIIIEAALVVKEARDICDEMWYVYTSRENRMKRLAESRGYTREQTVSIMANQPSEEVFRGLCDHVIDNNGSLEETKRQIQEIL